MSGKKKQLYLITENYPFGIGEGPFVEPEIPYLKKHFNITLISLSLNNDQTSALDKDIKLIHHNRHACFISKLFACLRFFLCRPGWMEIKEILTFKGNKLPAFRDSIVYFGEAERFRRLLKKSICHPGSDRSDDQILIYNYWYFWGTLACTMLYRNDPNVKVITRSHRFDLYDEGYPAKRQPFKRYMNRYIDRIFFIAEHGRKYFLDKYNDKADTLQGKCILSRLGVPGDKNQLPYDRRKGVQFTLVSCSSLIPRKRVDLIIKALSRISDTKINWIHFGDGPEHDALTVLCSNLLAHKDNITYTFMGNTKTESILKFYSENRIDAFITTTSSEGCPVSIQEALSYGIPIIGTSVAEIPYMIQGNGILLSEDPSEAEVKEAIERLSGISPDEKNIMSQRSLEIWENEFNSGKNYYDFSNILNELIK